jgi:hypothetical protein
MTTEHQKPACRSQKVMKTSMSNMEYACVGNLRKIQPVNVSGLVALEDKIKYKTPINYCTWQKCRVLATKILK